jgi:hypothetical protein
VWPGDVRAKMVEKERPLVYTSPPEIAIRIAASGTCVFTALRAPAFELRHRPGDTDTGYMLDRGPTDH